MKVSSHIRKFKLLGSSPVVPIYEYMVFINIIFINYVRISLYGPAIYINAEISLIRRLVTHYTYTLDT